MSLPIVILPTEEKWDCHQCGICCRGSLVPLDDVDIENLRSQKWDEHPGFLNTPIMVRNRSSQRPYRLAHRIDGSCVFLSDQGLCQIHSKFGPEAKPTVCRVFPLQLIPRSGSVSLTIRRACPSAAADSGSLLKQHLPIVQKFVREGRLSADAIKPPELKTGEHRNWKIVELALVTASELLLDQRYPPVRRLVHTLQFANLLTKAKTKPMEDRKLSELIRTLPQICLLYTSPSPRDS